MKATITSLIFLLLSLTVSSQTYKYIGIEEGLSNQKIYKIQKDARGYMWFLTHVGIDQYNGKEIKHYKLREGNRELDPLLNINWTFLDKTGTLLVTGKQGRIFRYDSGHDRFNPAKRNVLDLKNETCKNREKRNVLKISHTRHYKITKKQSKTGCFYSF